MLRLRYRAERGGIHERHGREVEDQVRVIGCGRLVEPRSQRVERVEVQLPLGAMTTGSGTEGGVPVSPCRTPVADRTTAGARLTRWREPAAAVAHADRPQWK